MVNFFTGLNLEKSFCNLSQLSVNHSNWDALAWAMVPFYHFTTADQWNIFHRFNVDRTKWQDFKNKLTTTSLFSSVRVGWRSGEGHKWVDEPGWVEGKGRSQRGRDALLGSLKQSRTTSEMYFPMRIQQLRLTNEFKIYMVTSLMKHVS